MLYFKNFKRAQVRIIAPIGGHVFNFEAGEVHCIPERFEEDCLSGGLVPCSEDGGVIDFDADFEARVDAETAALEAESEAAKLADIENEEEKAKMLASAAEAQAAEAKLKRSQAAAKGQATKKANAAKLK